MVPLSILDLAPITDGSDAATALHNSRDLARHAERWGYKRYWLAEHHNMPGIASAATSLAIAHVAAGTSTIRVGAGGIMLPNHAPLVIAEQFGTLEALFPGRIDLGVGRAPGTDHTTARALRRTLATSPEAFPQDLLELLSYFHAPPTQSVRAVPGAGMRIPLYVLGSSIFGAQVAAAFGLPFAFASHFAPAYLFQALEHYRGRYQPSDQCPRPYTILGVNVVAADRDEDAALAASSGRQWIARLRSGMPTTLPPPDAAFARAVEPFDADTRFERLQSVAIVGSAETVRRGLGAFVERAAPDELIVVSHVYDHGARLRSYELLAEIGRSS